MESVSLSTIPPTPPKVQPKALTMRRVVKHLLFLVIVGCMEPNCGNSQLFVVLGIFNFHLREEFASLNQPLWGGAAISESPRRA